MVLLTAACKPTTPSRYIQEDDIEDILVDYYLAKAMAQEDATGTGNREFNQALYIESVLATHGVTQEFFDSSLVYYYTRADRFADICERVTKRLEDMALVLGASEGEIGKYAIYNATGDTANIWPDRPTALMMPIPPYNRWDFHIDADSTYRRGDALMMQFMSDYMYQSGSKDGTLYMAVVYPDTVVGRNMHFSVSGLSQLRVPEDTTRAIKAIKGYFYLGSNDNKTTTARLLFLKNVQLIRFHTINEENAKTDSIARDSIGGRLATDTLRRRDSLGSSNQLLPVDTGAATHGVAAGNGAPET